MRAGLKRNNCGGSITHEGQNEIISHSRKAVPKRAHIGRARAYHSHDGSEEGLWAHSSQKTASARATHIQMCDRHRVHRYLLVLEAPRSHRDIPASSAQSDRRNTGHPGDDNVMVALPSGPESHIEPARYLEGHRQRRIGLDQHLGLFGSTLPGMTLGFPKDPCIQV